MSNLKERYWWVFPVWRAILYMFCMAMLWGLPLLILGGIISYIIYLFEEPPPPNADFHIEYWFVFMLLTVLVSLINAVLGAIPGLCAGIRAPASEPINPFKSKFFRTVSKQTFGFLWLSIGIFYANIVLLSSLVSGTFVFYDNDLVVFWLIGSIGGYKFGIVRALTNASNQLKQKPYID
jgi:hypothetical protein